LTAFYHTWLENGLSLFLEPLAYTGHKKQENYQQVRQWGLTYIHTCQPTSTRHATFHERRISSVTFAVAGRFVRFWASGEAKFPKMEDSLPRTPMNHSAKFYTTSFILVGEIRNRTNTHTHTHTQTNSKRYIHTLCLSACVDNKVTKVTDGYLVCQFMRQ